MRRDEATRLTRQLLDEHGLPDYKIRLVTELRNPFLGKCDYNHKCIYLNAHHIDTHHDILIRDTILHEIAHALTVGHSHDNVWREKAKELGSNALEPCVSFGFDLTAIDAIRSGDIVECEVEEETIIKRTPKYTIHKLQDICPECGRVAKELFSFETTDGTNDVKMITLECYHIIKKIIPRATPYQDFITHEHENNGCAHEWDKNRCVLCNAFKLFPFQVEGARFLEKALALNKGGAIFDEMGLGKTVQALAYIKYHPESVPFLWIGKSGIKYQYLKEIIRWLGPDFLPLVITGGKSGVLPGLKSYIISYDLLRRFPREKIESLGIKTVILDECQAVKNPDSTRTQEVRDLIRNVEHVIPLSGTPWKNRGSEFFVALNMLDPKRFNSFERFKHNWVDYYWDGNKYKEGGIRRPDQFREHIKDLAIRRERVEVMPELPTVSRNVLYCEVPDHARKALIKQEQDLINIYNSAIIGGEEDSFANKAAMMQSLIVMRQIVGLAKVDPTIEFVSEFLESTDRKLCVFVHHKSVGEQITERVRALVSGMNGNAPLVLQLTADKSSEERFDLQEQFNSNPKVVMIASTLASGEGLNLQTCSDCVMVERQWNPANEEQAEGRFIRIGQTANAVNATYMTAENSVDSDLHAIVERKRVAFHNTMSKGQMAIWNEADVTKELIESIVRRVKK